MAKDFANKKSPGRQAKPKRAAPKPAAKSNASSGAGSKIPIWMWLFTSICVLAFIGLLIYLGQQSSATKADKTKAKQVETQVVRKPAPKPVAKPAAKPAPTPKPAEKPAAAKEKPKEPEWTFPQELSKREVQVEIDPVANRPLKEYIMQCGSFRKKEQAEQLEARIAFTGLQATVKATEGKTGLWFRVVLGPYQGKRSADKDRHLLQQNKIEGCQVW